MYKYSVRQGGVPITNTFSVDIDFIQGMYSGWLLSSVYAISDKRTNVMEQLYDGGFRLYLVSIDKVDDTELKSVAHQVLQIGKRSIMYFPSEAVPDAFNKAVSFPISFCWSLPLVHKVGDINPMLLPYHIVPNFSNNYAILEDTDYLRDMVAKHTELDRNTDLETLQSILFSTPIDEDLCRYAIGTTITGMETYLLKVPLKAKLDEFLQGLLSLYISHYQDSRYRKVHTYEMPKLYMYDYGKEILLKPSKDKKSVTIPVLVTEIAFS
jgi:hypothetical protein